MNFNGQIELWGFVYARKIGIATRRRSENKCSEIGQSVQHSDESAETEA